MKTILILLSFVFSFQLFAQSTETVPVSLDDLVKKVGSENYTVYESSLRVYQAKESITVARMNLLPRLNIWKLAQAAVEIYFGGPTGAAAGAFSLVEDITPFLVPANWFRVSQTKLFYQADLQGYKALWANEVMTAKALYFHLLLDQQLRENVTQSRKDLEKIYSLAKLRETFGGSTQKVSQELKIRMLSLDEDLRVLDVLIAEEESLLAFALGLPVGAKVKPMPVEMPNYDELEFLSYDDFEYRAIENSPEIKQFNYIIKAADYAKKEIVYAFLGSSSASRGTSSGVFDNLPVQTGLGFGTSASIRISKTQKKILKVQQQAVAETLKRHLKLLVNNYNLDISNYNNLSTRSQLTRELLDQIYKRLKYGETVDSLQIIEASKNLIDAQTALASVKFRFLNSEDKLSRLIFYGDYAGADDALKQVQEKK